MLFIPPALGSGAITVTTTAVGAVLFLAMASNYHRRQKQLKKESERRIAKLEETRRAERTGRIRAEMKLRTVLKNKKEVCDDNTTITNGNWSVRVGRDDEDRNDDDDDDDDDDADDTSSLRPLVLHRIGTIKSPYTKRMGTPRQGALVPSGRGYIQLDVPVECVMGLENYSHAWILFSFHANTDSPSSSSSSVIMASTKSNKLYAAWSNLSKTKIRPPRGNGIKVGMLATRSPHRPNNIGLSLVRLSNLDIRNKRLHITALDLVDGTPVYDMKPCVPWDVPGHYDGKALVVPKWVSCDDELESVIFDPVALDALATYVQKGKLAPLYTATNDGIVGATETIREILAQDPRASNSNNSNKRGTTSSSSGRWRHDNIESYKMLFCSVEVVFRVDKVNGGCHDGVVTVMHIRDYIDLDVVERVDGIPILLR